MQVTRLSWGVKQSFCNYVQSTGGLIEAGGDAEWTADGGFSFAAAGDSGLTLNAEGKPEGIGQFLGEARFEAHGGMLSVRLVDPALEIGPAGAILTVADGRAGGRRLEIAKLDLAAMTPGDAGEIVIPATLSLDGIQVLGDHYPMRTPLDPVRLTFA